MTTRLYMESYLSLQHRLRQHQSIHKDNHHNTQHTSYLISRPTASASALHNSPFLSSTFTGTALEPLIPTCSTARQSFDISLVFSSLWIPFLQARKSASRPLFHQSSFAAFGWTLTFRGSHISHTWLSCCRLQQLWCGISNIPRGRLYEGE